MYSLLEKYILNYFILLFNTFFFLNYGLIFQYIELKNVNHLINGG